MIYAIKTSSPPPASEFPMLLHSHSKLFLHIALRTKSSFWLPVLSDVVSYVLEADTYIQSQKKWKFVMEHGREEKGGFG